MPAQAGTRGEVLVRLPRDYCTQRNIHGTQKDVLADYLRKGFDFMPQQNTKRH